MVIANPLSWESEMRGWSFPIHFVGNKKLGLSERSSDVAGTFTQGQLPHFFPLVSDECGCPDNRSLKSMKVKSEKPKKLTVRCKCYIK